MVTLALVQGDLQLHTISQATALKQRLKNRLALYLGEWWLEPSSGVNWFSVLGKTNISAIESLVRKELSKEENITRIDSIEVVIIDSLEKSQTYNKPLNFALIKYVVLSIYGEIRGAI